MSEIVNILSSLGFNWHVALANFVNFLIILFVLNKFFFGKIGKVIKERKDVIEKGLQDANDAKTLLLHTEEEKASILNEAKKEGIKHLKDVEEKAEKQAKATRLLAEEEIQGKIRHLDAQEKHLKETVESNFAKQAPALIAKLYEKTLSNRMTQEENNAFITSLK